MAFANPNYSDILATTIESRTRQIADNVTNNNAVLQRLSKKGKIRPFSGGHKILQELSFAENSNAGYYSGYDLLPVGVSDVISAAEYDIKQAAVPVVMSGLEMLQNSGKERMIDLMQSRLEVAESTLANLITAGIYSDGTGFGGKEIDGLNAAVPLDPTAAPYGGIDGATFTFWQNAVSDQTAAAVTAATIQGFWNGLWAQLVRGADRPDLIMVDNVAWETYIASLQAQQRFTNTNTADAGFMSVKFMDADVVLDGGIYNGDVTGATGAPAGTAYFLNCNYIHYRPHSARNMVPLSPNRRYSTNQDAEVQILAWAGNLTTSGRQFQGRFDMNG
ncbi:MAG: phage major capsid protein [Phycisphaerae bacterium]|nr:phage major capsid protein [Phycisphaerae bacterium]NIS54159.1 phage major capsid protein [Phycisphaerae bacterium]NIV01124.1 phage major capsid protein [Phycisphaerae bacterium]NIW98154.1 phage major capsid protein [Phycisphaerae bacterium]